MTVAVHDITGIPVSELAPNPWNPNVQPPAAFELLARSIGEDGFMENLVVVPREVMEQAEDQKAQEWCREHREAGYMLVWGEHRWRATHLLDESAELPCVVLPERNLAKIKALVTRGNLLRGEADKRRFTALYDDVQKEYGPEAAKGLMGLYSEQQFNKLYREVKATLPPDMQETLDEKKPQIKTMDGLAQVLNSLWNQYGDTLPMGFMAFTFGGKLCYLIEMDARLKGAMQSVTDRCRAEERNINELLSLFLQRGMELSVVVGKTPFAPRSSAHSPSGQVRTPEVSDEVVNDSKN